MIIVLNTNDFSTRNADASCSSISVHLDSCPEEAEESQFLKQMKGWL